MHKNEDYTVDDEREEKQQQTGEEMENKQEDEEDEKEENEEEQEEIGKVEDAWGSTGYGKGVSVKSKNKAEYSSGEVEDDP